MAGNSKEPDDAGLSPAPRTAAVATIASPPSAAETYATAGAGGRTAGGGGMNDPLRLRLCRWCGRLAVLDRSADAAYVCAPCRKRGGTELLAPPGTGTALAAPVPQGQAARC